jgi:septum site-determining protein MinC
MAEKRQSTGPMSIRVRGTQDGLVMQLPADVPLATVLGQVRSSVDGAGDFYRHGEIVLDYGTRPPNLEEILALRSLLAERGVRLRTVTSSVPEFRDLLRGWGYHPLRPLPEQQGEDDLSTEPSIELERSAYYVRRTLRSGASVHSDEDVIIMGDVNAGAEVSSGGDVIVWGTLRGTVHAGLRGDQAAIICALRFMPTQLRIGSVYARSPDEPGETSTVPMIARVVDGDLVVEPWRSGRRQA